MPNRKTNSESKGAVGGNEIEEAPVEGNENEEVPAQEDEEEDGEDDVDETQDRDVEKANAKEAPHKHKKSKKPKPSRCKKYSIIVLVLVLVVALILVLYYVQREPIYLDFTKPPNITTTTASALTTTMKATMRLRTMKPVAAIRSYSDSKRSKIDSSLYNTPVLSRCQASNLNGATIPNDPFIDNIRSDWVGNHYKPGCRYYFVMDRTKTQKDASDYCQKNGAFLAIIEDYLEECYIAHKLDLLRRRGTSVDRLWIAGETYTDTTKILPNSKHPVYVRWSPEKPISTASVYNHLCIYQPVSELTAEPQPVKRLVEGYNLVLDYTTFGLDIPTSVRRDVGCWRTYHRTSALNFICKKCIVNV